MEGCPIVESSSIKLVGINTNNTMSWHDHVVTFAKTASQKLGALFRCRKLFTPELLRLLYNHPTIVGLDKLQAESLELKRIPHEKEVNIEQSVNDWENEKKDLRIVMENLEKDIIDREVHLNKLKKMMREFEDAAMENETTHIEEIKKQKDVISQLCDEMSHLQQINDELKSKIETYEKDMQHLDKNIVDITDINRNMVTTIEVLEQENRMFAAQLKIHKQPCKENHSYDLETIDLTVPSSEGKKRVDNGFTIGDMPVCVKTVVKQQKQDGATCRTADASLALLHERFGDMVALKVNIIQSIAQTLPDLCGRVTEN
nr:unnamed protein product [Callosobruchus analis]